ncbi:Ger(x)C family germination protein [Ureibacillus xyleni]|uniref:Ger(X)C family germination protein n=1 Tax=Ureibacillus xyleni TaxID=614648 RepID=A0A285TM56_9BACL|nr:Ger(x)C family spore germination protein [Ureibacillus xyleni]SOC23794.1 Ger(x)C family germination protein [Ureibacillus xyleni]
MLLLAGCWDERLYKDHTVVSLVGIEGTLGEMKGYFAYPEVQTGNSEVTIIESEGIETRELRLNADLKVEQTIDLSMMSTLLISEDTAKDGINKYLDVFYRDPTNSLTAFLVLVEGDVKDYMEASKSWTTEAGEYFARFIRSKEEVSVVPHRTVQTASSILFSEGIDLVLPYMVLKDEDKKRPELGGVGLFSNGKFTGRVLEPDQSKFLGLLLQERGRKIKYSALYNDQPLSFTILNVGKTRKIQSPTQVKMDYKLKIEIEEFSDTGLRDVKKISEIEDFIEEKITEEIYNVLNILQEEKCDALGLGNDFRVKKPEVFDENWHETFSNLDIQVNVKAEILKTGLIH